MNSPHFLSRLFAGSRRFWKTYSARLAKAVNRLVLFRDDPEPSPLWDNDGYPQNTLPPDWRELGDISDYRIFNPFAAGEEASGEAQQSACRHGIIRPLKFLAKTVEAWFSVGATPRPVKHTFRPGVEELEGLIMPSNWGGHGAWDSGGMPSVVAGQDPGTFPIANIDMPQAYSGGTISAAVDWGDGSAQDTGSVQFDSANNDFVVSDDHVYASAGGYLISVYVTNNGNNQAYVEDLLTVQNPGSSGGSSPSGNISLSLPGTQANTEGDSVGFSIGASADDNSSITNYWISRQPAGISIDNNGNISGTIDGAASQVNGGAYSVIVTAEDSNGLFGSAMFTWDVSAQPSVVYSPGTWYDSAGTYTSLTITTRSVGGSSITGFSLSGAPAGLSIDQYGTISGNIDANASGSYSVTVSANDSRGETGSTTFTFQVFQNSSAVSLDTPGDQNNAEGDPVYLAMDASSTNGAIVSYSMTGQPSGVTIDNDGNITGTIGYTDAETNGGQYRVAISATDVANQASYIYVNWAVTHYDPPPVLDTPDTQTSNVGQTISLDGSASAAPNGDAVANYALSGQPGGLTINTSTGYISGTIASNAGGVYDVVETAASVTGAVADAEFPWIVRNGGAGATLTSPGSQTYTEGDNVDFTVAATPPSGHSVAYWQISGEPSGLTIDPQTGEIMGSPDYGQGGVTYPTTVTATDDDGGQGAVTFNIQVNTAPPIIDDPGTQTNFAEDAIDLPISAEDPNGLTLSYSMSGPSWLHIDPNTGEITGTVPDSAPSTTPYSVTVTATNAAEVSASDTFSMSITPVADALTLDGGFELGAAVNQQIHLNLATLTDANPASTPATFSLATIDWGDGTSEQHDITIVTLGDKIDGMYQVGDNHTYAKDGTYHVEVDVAAGNQTPVVADSTVVVGDLIAGVSETVPLFSILPSVLAAELASSSDPTPSGFTATLESNPVFSSGTVNMALNNTTGKYDVTGTFDFVEDSLGASGGNFNIDVILGDTAGSTKTIGTPLIVVPPAIALTVNDIPADAGSDFVLATFTDPASNYDDPADFNVSVNWGDGSTSVWNIAQQLGQVTVDRRSDGAYEIKGNHDVIV